MPEDLLTVAMPPHRVWHQGGARPVLALHCSLAHAGAWAGLAAGLHGVTITATDQIGHGRAADWDGVSDLHAEATPVSYTHLDVYKRQDHGRNGSRQTG